MIDRNTNVQITDEALAFAKPMLAEVSFKCCSKCKLDKSIDLFYNSKINKDGKDGTCKKCKQETATNWNKKNKDVRRNIVMKSQNKRIEKHRENGRRYFSENKEKYKQWVKDNPDKRKNIANSHAKKMIDTLGNSYVKQKAKRMGFTIEQLNKNPEITETIKIIIKTKRLCKTSQN